MLRSEIKTPFHGKLLLTGRKCLGPVTVNAVDESPRLIRVVPGLEASAFLVRFAFTGSGVTLSPLCKPLSANCDGFLSFSLRLSVNPQIFRGAAPVQIVVPCQRMDHKRHGAGRILGQKPNIFYRRTKSISLFPTARGLFVQVRDKFV